MCDVDGQKSSFKLRGTQLSAENLYLVGTTVATYPTHILNLPIYVPGWGLGLSAEGWRRVAEILPHLFNNKIISGCDALNISWKLSVVAVQSAWQSTSLLFLGKI